MVHTYEYSIKLYKKNKKKQKIHVDSLIKNNSNRYTWICIKVKPTQQILFINTFFMPFPQRYVFLDLSSCDDFSKKIKEIFFFKQKKLNSFYPKCSVWEQIVEIAWSPRS